MNKSFLLKISLAKNIIQKAIDKYKKIALGCSFGKDSMVTLHLCLQIDPKIKVFSVMGDTEFNETYAFEKQVVKKYHLNYYRYNFKQDPKLKEDLSLCCGQPKVEATKKAVAGLDAWISGVRNTEGISRVKFDFIENAYKFSS